MWDVRAVPLVQRGGGEVVEFGGDAGAAVALLDVVGCETWKWLGDWFVVRMGWYYSCWGLRRRR
jgi:hypothetical protein